jgi:hypothetical protein
MVPDCFEYHASWVDPPRNRCFQVMEAPDVALLQLWTSRWDDLVDFEVIPVLPSSKFWSSISPPPIRSSPQTPPQPH